MLSKVCLTSQYQFSSNVTCETFVSAEIFQLIFILFWPTTKRFLARFARKLARFLSYHPNLNPVDRKSAIIFDYEIITDNFQDFKTWPKF